MPYMMRKIMMGKVDIRDIGNLRLEKNAKHCSEGELNEQLAYKKVKVKKSSDYESYSNSEPIYDTVSNMESEDSRSGIMVLISCCWVKFILFGLLDTYGLFLVTYKKKFPETSEMKFGLVGTLGFASTFIFTLFMHPALKIFGYKKVYVIGGAVAGIGLVLASFTKSIEARMDFAILGNIVGSNNSSIFFAWNKTLGGSNGKRK
ncbi:hypothetical protein AYI70_g11872 [Smittium culicis]|uniref:Uncharacterized protein n=1 Tax=Smittium culicis TaxID=133412 RepID=A0A1R1X002_9FUNG|nr:hypothetical protein AYI70_g11872 [Smittium culicis]